MDQNIPLEKSSAINLDEIIKKYYESGMLSDQDMVSILKEAKRMTESWVSSQSPGMRDRISLVPFSEDIALDFLRIVLEQKCLLPPELKIQNLARDKLKGNRGGASGDIWKAYEETVEVEHPNIERDAFVKKLLENLPQRTQSLLLYLIVYPEESKHLRQITQGFELEYYVVALRVARLKGHGHMGDFKIPKSENVSTIYLMLALLNTSPELAALALLVKDFQKFFEVCLMLQSRDIKFPSEKQIKHIITESLHLAQVAKCGNLSSDDKKSLELLISECQSDPAKVHVNDFSVTDGLVTFLSTSIKDIAKRDSDFFDYLIKVMECEDSSSIERVYEALNSNLQSSFNLLNTMLTGISKGGTSVG